MIALDHDLADSRLRTIGSVQAVVVGRDGKQYGAGDRRRIGAAVSLKGRGEDDDDDDDDE